MKTNPNNPDLYFWLGEAGDLTDMSKKQFEQAAEGIFEDEYEHHEFTEDEVNQFFDGHEAPAF